MIYLSQFIFPSVETEEKFLHDIKETCYTSVYPFQILTRHKVRTLNLDELVTLLYGGNGSGKTTVLNGIAEKLKLNRDTLYNRTHFFEDYIGFCDYVLERELPQLRSIEDYEQLVKVNAARKKSKSRYVKEQLKENIREHSNGESAYLYFTDKILDNGLYLLDEPENSLSPGCQQKLVNDRKK